MRDLRLLDARRMVEFELMLTGRVGGSREGAFGFPSESSVGELRVVASAGLGWDHVSVSRADRCPTWAEMEQVKRLFFNDDETAMQLHVPACEHVNNHPYCLHLWRPHAEAIPRPPAAFVGVKDMTPAEASGLTTAEVRAIQDRESRALERPPSPKRSPEGTGPMQTQHETSEATAPSFGRQEYLIEAMESGGRWYIVGSERLSHIAQDYKRRYQRERPSTAFRVVEYPSRRIVCLYDPTGSAA